MKRLVIWGLLLALILPLVQASVSEAAGISIRPAEREMKKDKDHEATDLYERAHRIIYGDKAPMGPDGRVRIAVVLTGDEWTMVEDRVKNQIYKQLRDKFPRENFALMKGTDVRTYLLQREEDVYAQERNTVVGNMPKDLSSDVDGMKVGDSEYHATQGIKEGFGVFGLIGSSHLASNRFNKENSIRDLADLRLDDYVWAGRKGKYDYVFTLKLALGGSREELHQFPLFNSVTRKQNMHLVVRLVDTKAGDYAYRNNLVVAGESHNSGFNGRIFEKAIKAAMQEALNDIAFEGE